MDSKFDIRIIDRGRVKSWQRDVEQVIAEHRRRNTPEVHNVAGRSFWIAPDVFSPFIAPSGCVGLAFSSLPILRGKFVVEVGVGSGIFSCLAAINGARRVLGTDISASAINNAAENVRQSELGSIVEIRRGSTLGPLCSDDCPDVIYADLPFCDGQLFHDDLDRAFFDQCFAVTREFLGFLTKPQFSTTMAFLCLSNLESFDVKEECRRRGLNCRPYLTIDLDWICLTLWKITRRRTNIQVIS